MDTHCVVASLASAMDLANFVGIKIASKKGNLNSLHTHYVYNGDNGCGNAVLHSGRIQLSHQ